MIEEYKKYEKKSKYLLETIFQIILENAQIYYHKKNVKEIIWNCEIEDWPFLIFSQRFVFKSDHFNVLYKISENGTIQIKSFVIIVTPEIQVKVPFKAA